MQGAVQAAVWPGQHLCQDLKSIRCETGCRVTSVSIGCPYHNDVVVPDIHSAYAPGHVCALIIHLVFGALTCFV